MLKQVVPLKRMLLPLKQPLPQMPPLKQPLLQAAQPRPQLEVPHRQMLVKEPLQQHRLREAVIQLQQVVVVLQLHNLKVPHLQAVAKQLKHPQRQQQEERQQPLPKKLMLTMRSHSSHVKLKAPS